MTPVQALAGLAGAVYVEPAVFYERERVHGEVDDTGTVAVTPSREGSVSRANRANENSWTVATVRGSIGEGAGLTVFYRAEFAVGVQYFELAHVLVDDNIAELEAGMHCRRVAHSFLQALARLGVSGPETPAPCLDRDFSER